MGAQGNTGLPLQIILCLNARPCAFPVTRAAQIRLLFISAFVQIFVTAAFLDLSQGERQDGLGQFYNF